MYYYYYKNIITLTVLLQNAKQKQKFTPSASIHLCYTFIHCMHAKKYRQKLKYMTLK